MNLICNNSYSYVLFNINFDICQQGENNYHYNYCMFIFVSKLKKLFTTKGSFFDSGLNKIDKLSNLYHLH